MLIENLNLKPKDLKTIQQPPVENSVIPPNTEKPKPQKPRITPHYTGIDSKHITWNQPALDQFAAVVELKNQITISNDQHLSPLPQFKPGEIAVMADSFEISPITNHHELFDVEFNPKIGVIKISIHDQVINQLAEDYQRSHPGISTNEVFFAQFEKVITESLEEAINLEKEYLFEFTLLCFVLMLGTVGSSLLLTHTLVQFISASFNEQVSYIGLNNEQKAFMLLFDFFYRFCHLAANSFAAAAGLAVYGVGTSLIKIIAASRPEMSNFLQDPTDYVPIKHSLQSVGGRLLTHTRKFVGHRD